MKAEMQVEFVSVALLAERLAEGRGSATVATAENNQVPKSSPMRQKPRYLQRLVRPALAKRSDDVWLAREHIRVEGII